MAALVRLLARSSSTWPSSTSTTMTAAGSTVVATFFGGFGLIAYLVMARDKQSTEPFDLFYATVQETPFAWRSYYNIACYFANSGKAEQAISFLEKALQRGLKIKTLIDKEPYFATLRDQESFKALLAKYFPG